MAQVSAHSCDLSGLDKSEGIALFTDGSAWNKDKSGGWAWLALDAFDGEATASGALRGTTNNRMELMAWIKGLETLLQELGPCQVLVYSDSEYVGLGAIDRTRHRNCNHDLWQLLDDVIDRHAYIEFCHVRGHTGHSYNEFVDRLASEARKEGKDNAATDTTDNQPTDNQPKTSKSAIARRTTTQRRPSGRGDGRQSRARARTNGTSKRRSRRSR